MIKILLESIPLQSRILIRELAVEVERTPQTDGWHLSPLQESKVPRRQTADAGGDWGSREECVLIEVERGLPFERSHGTTSSSRLPPFLRARQMRWSCLWAVFWDLIGSLVRVAVWAVGCGPGNTQGLWPGWQSGLRRRRCQTRSPSQRYIYIYKTYVLYYNLLCVYIYTHIITYALYHIVCVCVHIYIYMYILYI